MKYLFLGSFMKYLVVSFLIGLSLLGCSLPEVKIDAIKGRTMGTSYSIIWPSQSNINTDQLRQQIDQMLARLNSQMSTYQVDSELSKFNAENAPVKQEISAEFSKVMALSLQIAEYTDGYFDVSVGPLVNMWGFGPDNQPISTPNVASIEAKLKEVGISAIQLEGPVLTKSEQRYIDLSAIAKGFAVDEAAKILDRAGINSYLVEIGGEMRAKGLKSADTPWKIAIEAPDFIQRKVQKILPITDVAVATSGDYRNFYELEGKRYSHSINPKTGYPVEHSLASVTIIDNECARADALATAMLVMGIDKAKEFALVNDIKAYMVVRNEQGDFEEYLSSAFIRWFTP